MGAIEFFLANLAISVRIDAAERQWSARRYIRVGRCYRSYGQDKQGRKC